MRAVVQRVSEAAVTVGDRILGEIGAGLVVLVGVTDGDGHDDARTIADKVAGLRIFADDEAKMNRSVADISGSVLVVSQFTLYGDARKGRRPSFVRAAEPPVAEPLIDQVVERIQSHGITVATGSFGAHMHVRLVNDGPVTLLLETDSGRMV
ncbi:MAG: D-aminoacyl-tRNA deacylase [Acidimicrobiia bacterium]|nr:D-aminoacyl-tRNA deacylase [Acidimicrobiia bacterium]